MRPGTRTLAALAALGGAGALLVWLERRGPRHGEAGTVAEAGPEPPASPRPRSGPGLAGAILLALVLVGLAGLGGWEAVAARQRHVREASIRWGGDPEQGRAHMVRYGCAGCHEITGLGVPQGRVGPPLTDITRRTFIAGRLRNTPDNLVNWIVDPKAIDPRTAMPVTGISPQEARDVAAALELQP